MKKVLKLNDFRKPKPTRTCSFSTVSDRGNMLYGTAAFLVVAKRNGGIDNYIRGIATNAAQNALASAISSGKKSA